MESFKNFLKSLRRKKRNVITVCPKCGNARIHQLNSLSGWLTPLIYVCNKCGYIGPILLEINSPHESLEK